MKKLFSILFVAAIMLGMASCKKDETMQPLKSGKNVVSDKKDLGTGD